MDNKAHVKLVPVLYCRCGGSILGSAQSQVQFQRLSQGEEKSHEDRQGHCAILDVKISNINIKYSLPGHCAGKMRGGHASEREKKKGSIGQLG